MCFTDTQEAAQASKRGASVKPTKRRASPSVAQDLNVALRTLPILHLDDEQEDDEPDEQLDDDDDDDEA